MRLRIASTSFGDRAGEWSIEIDVVLELKTWRFVAPIDDLEK